MSGRAVYRQGHIVKQGPVIQYVWCCHNYILVCMEKDTSFDILAHSGYINMDVVIGHSQPRVLYPVVS